MVIGAEAGYSDPWFLVVSAGLRKATWPARFITAAYGQRFTTEGCFRDQKNDLYEGFQPRRGPMRHPGTLGSDAVGLCLDLLRAQRGRMGQGTGGERSGLASPSRPEPTDPCFMALGPWGTPGGGCGMAHLMAGPGGFSPTYSVGEPHRARRSGRHLAVSRLRFPTALINRSQTDAFF